MPTDLAFGAFFYGGLWGGDIQRMSSLPRFSCYLVQHVAGYHPPGAPKPLAHKDGNIRAYQLFAGRCNLDIRGDQSSSLPCRQQQKRHRLSRVCRRSYSGAKKSGQGTSPTSSARARHKQSHLLTRLLICAMHSPVRCMLCNSFLIRTQDHAALDPPRLLHS